VIPVTTRCKAWVCGRSFTGVAGSNPAGNMQCMSLVGVVRLADHSSRGILPSVMLLMCVLVKP